MTLEEVITQLADLSPEGDYQLDVAENNITVKNSTGEDIQLSSEDVAALQAKVEEQSSQIDKLKLTNRALLLKTPTQQNPQTPEEMIMKICGRTGEDNGEA